MKTELCILDNLFEKVNEMENKQNNIDIVCRYAAIDTVGVILSGIMYFKSNPIGDVALFSAPLIAECSDADITKMIDEIMRGIGHSGNLIPINLSSKKDQQDRIDTIRSLSKKPLGNVLVLRHDSLRLAVAPNVDVTIAVYDIDGSYGLMTLLSRRG